MPAANLCHRIQYIVFFFRPITDERRATSSENGRPIVTIMWGWFLLPNPSWVRLIFSKWRVKPSSSHVKSLNRLIGHGKNLESIFVHLQSFHRRDDSVTKLWIFSEICYMMSFSLPKSNFLWSEVGTYFWIDGRHFKSLPGRQIGWSQPWISYLPTNRFLDF